MRFENELYLLNGAPVTLEEQDATIRQPYGRLFREVGQLLFTVDYGCDQSSPVLYSGASARHFLRAAGVKRVRSLEGKAVRVAVVADAMQVHQIEFGTTLDALVERTGCNRGSFVKSVEVK